MSRGVHLVYTFEIRTRCGRRARGRVTSASDATALRRIADKMPELLKPEEQLASFLILEVFPKSQQKRQEALNRKKAQRERRKKEEQAKYFWYRGTERIDPPEK